ncbi:MAG: hypothetical protein KKB62_02375 [Nanoarchaeota archaeon]|jgi:hypothetical protein|nr:hypothetical protein [Nanoarchaeota archaeon]
MARLNRKEEGIFAIVAALAVLITAMWDPIVSVVISIIALVFFAEQSFAKK